MKTYPRIIRRDASEDHVHHTPDGKKTQGALAKPSQSLITNPHTHLYEHEGKVHETGVASDNEPGHVHETMMGETSGPIKMPANASFGPRNDTAFRIGREWVVRNDAGYIVARGATCAEAEERAKVILRA